MHVVVERLLLIQPPTSQPARNALTLGVEGISVDVCDYTTVHANCAIQTQTQLARRCHRGGLARRVVLVASVPEVVVLPCARIQGGVIQAFEGSDVPEITVHLAGSGLHSVVRVPNGQEQWCLLACPLVLRIRARSQRDSRSSRAIRGAIRVVCCSFGVL
jgi:hypothetical protein